MASTKPFHPHFVLVPFLSQGHLIPMADIARILANHGANVTLVTTPVNALRLDSTINRARESGLPIKLLQLPFSALEAGLPEGCETMDALPSVGLIQNFFTAIKMLQQPFEDLIQEMSPGPSCIMSDKIMSWTADTASRFHIPRLLFDGTNCFANLCLHYLYTTKICEGKPISERFAVPGLPGDRVEFTRAQLPGEFNPGSVDMSAARKEIRAAAEKAYGVVINSFDELEPTYAEEWTNLKEKKAWCIGPVSLCNKDESDKAQRGNKASIDQSECLKWLDSWPQSSVIYASFGSISQVTFPQLIELGLGLEASERPFIWVIRGNRTNELKKWVEDEGFEERVKERGLLIWGWAPQVLILSHAATGGFLTHCGWNSTLEAISAGVPMVTWPLFAEQFFNEKLVVDVLRVGVRVGAEVAMHWGEEERFGFLVKREDVRSAVEELMGEGGKGNERRNRAKELEEMARNAVERGGPSFLNVDSLIEDVRQLALANQATETSGKVS